MYGVLMDVGRATAWKSHYVLVHCGCAVACSVSRVLCSPWALTLRAADAMDLCRGPGQGLDLSGTDNSVVLPPPLHLLIGVVSAVLSGNAKHSRQNHLLKSNF